jgi:hypothetical protein
MPTVNFGMSEAARLLDQTRRDIDERFNQAVTLSRNEAIESAFGAWQATEEAWKLNEDEIAISEEVRDTTTQFIEALPLGFPQPTVSGEPDGHINLEWYRHPRRVISVSIAPNNRLQWAALIGSESPRGAVRFIDRVPESILHFIARVFEG